MSTRSKYSYEFRLRCVESITKGNNSVGWVARENGVSPSLIRQWLSFYESYGRPGLKRRVTKSNYGADFKVNVLETIEKECLSLRIACVRFGIPSASVIIQWRRAYGSMGYQGLMPQPKGRRIDMSLPIKRKPKKTSSPLSREEELLQENERLRAENELLKKLHALVQTDKKPKP